MRAAVNGSDAAGRDVFEHAVHELRTPLTVARGHAQLIERRFPDHPAASDARVVVEELDRISRIWDGLSVLASVERQRARERSQSDLRLLVERAARRWRARAPRRWKVSIDLDETMLMDEETFGAALDALLDNAVRFTKKGHTIALRVKGGAGRAVVEVADSGCGIPAEYHASIFDCFYRLPRNGEQSNGAGGRNGSGLGLAIVKAVAEAHGGGVSVESEPGRGATFRLEVAGLPLNGDSEPRAPDVRSELDRASTRNGRKQRQAR